MTARAQPPAADVDMVPGTKSTSERVRELVAAATIELVPAASLGRAIGELRPASTISMTCSPAKSIEATLDETKRLLAAGHRVTPHISARMVTDDDHLRSIHARLVELGVRQIFTVAGDADPPGRFFDSIEFLDALIALDDASGTAHRQIDHIGFTAYPDSHPLIATDDLHAALHRKQSIVLGSGRSGHVSTQMCFDSDRILRWLRHERTAGLTVPVHLGVPGPIAVSKLITMGVRLGVGTSLRYLSKNRGAIGSLATRRSFRPDQILDRLAGDLESLGIDGIHLFTFNQVAAAEDWRERVLAG